ncbi:MAG: methylmalonyl Co-A mutase-associated GTPase MeaB, partial [Hymenobacteraceae bacterium]|nr:methylmalonyl Co-A mutase-associated GTPase MeaB [Hymenobacteraceae bacterium]
GQSETAVRSLTDCFVLLLLAGAGDELQGIKKGIIEMADVLAVTKTDGANAARAAAHAREMAGALHLLRPPEGGWLPPVLTCSAADGTGIAELWATVEAFLAHQRASGQFDAQRRRQQLATLRELVRQELETRFYARPEVAAALPEIEAAVARSELSVVAAVEKLLT